VEVLDRVDRERIDALRARGEYFWLDVHKPSEDDIEQLAEMFGLHPLAVEDTRSLGQRPKLDDYRDHVLIVFYGVAADGADDVELVEVHTYVSGDWVLTIHQKVCAELFDARRRFAEVAPAHSEEYVVYKVLDSLTDSFFPVLAAMDDRVDVLEDSMVTNPTDEQLNDIFALKRKLVRMRQVIGRQRALFQSAGTFIPRLPGLEGDQAHDYFRDVYDHLLRISEQIDTYRDLLTGALDVYLSVVSNRMNVEMKRLTVVATIFLPLTFITGFFGQNFGWLVRNITSLEVFILWGPVACVTAAIGLWLWFRRAGITG